MMQQLAPLAPADGLGLVFAGKGVQRQTQVCVTGMCYPLSIVLWAVQRDLGRTQYQMQRGAVATGVELFSC